MSLASGRRVVLLRSVTRWFAPPCEDDLLAGSEEDGGRQLRLLATENLG